MEIKVFTSHIKVTRFPFSVTLVWHDYKWLHVITARQICNFNFILFPWHISEMVRDMQERSSQGSFAVFCVLFVKCESLISVLIFHIYPRPLSSKCLSALRLKRCINKQPCPWVLRVFSSFLPKKAHNLSFEILSVISWKSKAQGLLSNGQPGWESVLHKYSAPRSVIVLGAQG